MEKIDKKQKNVYVHISLNKVSGIAGMESSLSRSLFPF